MRIRKANLNSRTELNRGTPTLEKAKRILNIRRIRFNKILNLWDS